MSASRRPIAPARKEIFSTPAAKKSAAASSLGRALRVYGTRHLQAMLLSLGQISRAPFTTLMIFMVIGIALALPAGLWLLLKNGQIVSQAWSGPAPIVLYLKTPAIEADSLALARQIQARPEVEKVDYISPDQGLAEFQKQAGFSEVIAALPQNPLPALLVVTAKADQQSFASMQALLNSLKALAAVDIAKLDLGWVQRLNALLNLGQRLVGGLALLLALGVVFIIGVTIHLTLQSHQEEIAVYKLLGATDGFIRRPFLYRGICYGLAGSIAAWLMVWGLLSWLAGPTAALAQLYSNHFSLQGLGAAGSLSLLAAGMLLGWLGAVVAVYQHRTRI